MDGTPVKIVYKKEMQGRCHCNNFGYGVIGNKKGEIIQAFKVNHKTNEKKIMFENKKEMKRMKDQIIKEKKLKKKFAN